MKWFDKWFAKKCRWVWENHNQLMQEENSGAIAAKPPSTLRHSHISKDYVDFKLWFADNGGYVIEFSKYDRRNDRNDNQIYIIPDGMDKLGEEITQIVTQYVIANR